MKLTLNSNVWSATKLRCFTCAVALICLVKLEVAGAALGEHKSKASSVDAVKLNARYKATETENYTVHEITMQGVVVNEYSNADGTVFAVTWRGIRRPDLKILLGSYSDEHERENQKQTPGPGRHQTTIRTPRLVVHRGGHMRDIHGEAYVPALVPAGVNPEVLP